MKPIKSIRLVGVGLIGGSIAKAARARWSKVRLVAVVRTQSRRRQLIRANLFDQVEVGFRDTKWQNEFIILCTPPESVAGLCREIAPRCGEGCVVTDVASVKGEIVQSFTNCQFDSGAEFVGSHPMAGSDKAGFENSSGDLLKGAVCIVTPTRLASKTAVDLVKGFWRRLGMIVTEMSADEHDHYLARSSHLVHLVASGLASSVLKSMNPDVQHVVCASGFRDTTRVASGEPGLWMEITRQNAGEISEALGGFVQELETLKAMVDRRDFAGVSRFLAEAKRLRDVYLKKKRGSKNSKIEPSSGE